MHLVSFLDSEAADDNTVISLVSLKTVLDESRVGGSWIRQKLDSCCNISEENLCKNTTVDLRMGIYFVVIDWTQSRMDEERIRAFEMLGLRRWVLEKAEVSRCLLKAIKKRKLTYIGHTTRKHDSLDEDIIMGLCQANGQEAG